MSNQPKWKLVGNLGDRAPLDYGGYFIFEDETGVYPPEAEMLVVDEELLSEAEDEPLESELRPYTAYRFILERCTLQEGILSDNKFHPTHPAWFAKPESEMANRPQDSTYLSRVASSIGMELSDLQSLFCSESSIDRAEAYRAIGDYHGYHELDHYALELTRREAQERYSQDRFSS